MLSASNIVKSYGPRRVLAGVDLTVPAHARIGLVGPNGVGKSTLLRILAGVERPDEGSVRRAGTAGYLAQTCEPRANETVLAYLERATGIAAAEAQVRELGSRLETDPHAADEYARALDRLVALGGGELEARARQVCADLGLRLELSHKPALASGGEQARVGLAAIVLSRYDVLLLDEPTNDLDFDGLDRLERFLAEFAGGVVVVSHDRAFLGRAVTKIVELQEGSGTVAEYAGGWSEYEAARAAARARRYERWSTSVEERRRVEEQARRMRQWEERGYGQGRKKKKTKDAKKAYAAKLAQIEVVEKPFEPWELRLELAAAGRSGDIVLSLAQAVVRRGDFSLGPLDLQIERGERLAVVGPNGAGKSMLLAALVGRLPLLSGTRRVGTGVVVGELDQERNAFARAEPLLDAFTGATGLEREPARTLLAKFDLGADDVLRSAASLSPGELTRAVLASLAARQVNCLVLDEPTNHLDVEAIEQLESALASYDGTLVLVTHDRRLLERLEPTRVLTLDTVASMR